MLSQRELAARIGKSHSYISHIEKGLRVPKMGTLHDLAEALGVPVDYLLHGTANSSFDLPEPAPLRDLLPHFDFNTKVVGSVNAGVPTLSDTGYYESLVDALQLNRKRHVLITVASETSNSVGFRQGDTVVVDMLAKPVVGNVVFAGMDGRPVLVRLTTDTQSSNISVAGVVVYVMRSI
jgi:transcriptional regulator with XRE-family HTH domain